MQSVTVADLGRQDVGATGDIGQGQAHEVVGDGETPEFLDDALRALAAQGGFLALQGMGFNFVVAEFGFPAFVVQGDDFGGGEGDGIEQRGEPDLRSAAWALVVDRAHGEELGQAGVQRAGPSAWAQAHEGIAGGEFLQGMQGCGVWAWLGTREPVTLLGGMAQGVEVLVGGELPIHDQKRLRRQSRPELACPGECAVAVGPEDGIQQQMRAQDPQRDQAQLGVGGGGLARLMPARPK